jgi:hypothetical protein
MVPESFLSQVLLNAFFGCLFLSAGIPLLLLVGAFILASTYWIDRWDDFRKNKVEISPLFLSPYQCRMTVFDQNIPPSSLSAASKVFQ